MAEWATTIAVKEYACPRCKAGKGEDCKTPKGKKTAVHGERTSQLSKADWDRCRGKACSANDFFSEVDKKLRQFAEDQLKGI